MQLATQPYNNLKITLHSDPEYTTYRVMVTASCADDMEEARKYSEAFYSHVNGVPTVREDASTNTIEVSFSGLNLEKREGEGAEVRDARKGFIESSFARAHSAVERAMQHTSVAVAPRRSGKEGRGW